MSFFIHRVLSKEEWPHVWSLLIGDERFTVCFGSRSLPENCQKQISQKIYEIKESYSFNNRGLDLKIYDMCYRSVE